MDSANRSYFREDFAGGQGSDYLVLSNKIWTNCGDKVLMWTSSCQCEREYYPQRIRRFAFRWNWSGLSVQFQKAQARGV